MLTWKWEKEKVEDRRAQHNNHPRLKTHSDLVDPQTTSITSRGQLTFEITRQQTDKNLKREYVLMLNCDLVLFYFAIDH